MCQRRIGLRVKFVRPGIDQCLIRCRDEAPKGFRVDDLDEEHIICSFLNSSENLRLVFYSACSFVYIHAQNWTFHDILCAVFMLAVYDDQGETIRFCLLRF